MSEPFVPPLLRDLFVAYYDARRQKRGTQRALRFELDYESQLFSLYEALVTRTYEISPSTCFIVKKPVMREIFAGDFRDRIVHHLVFNYLNPLCERLFMYDSYGCRTGKGVSCGIRRADYFIRSCSRNYTDDCFVLKLDISGYFMSMNRIILFEKVKIIIHRYQHEITFDIDLLLWLLQKIIFQDHTKHCLINGDRHDWVGLPPSKSLFRAKPNCGFPIGNLTSQLFGNIYLNTLDHFIRDSLGCRRYGRYVDDILLVHREKDVLKRWTQLIQKYLYRELALRIHPKKMYLQHCAKGVDFLGVFLRPHRIAPRHRLKGNFYRVIMAWNVLLIRHTGRLSDHQRASFLASINSYLGNIAHFQTRRLRRSMLRRLSPLVWKFASFGSPYKKIIARTVSRRSC
jgi:retron-type reverse transcriptase